MPADGHQHGLIRPFRKGDKLMQRLVCSLDPLGYEPSRHRLDPLALARQEQSGTVSLHRGDPIGMAEPFRKSTNISGKPLLTRLT
jgi:hypothetical protein